MTRFGAQLPCCPVLPLRPGSREHDGCLSGGQGPGRSGVRHSEPVDTYRFVGRFDRPSAGGARIGAGAVYGAATERLDDAAIDENPGRVVRGAGYGDHRTLLIAFDQSKGRRPARNDLEGVLLKMLRT